MGLQARRDAGNVLLHEGGSKRSRPGDLPAGARKAHPATTNSQEANSRLGSHGAQKWVGSRATGAVFPTENQLEQGHRLDARAPRSGGAFQGIGPAKRAVTAECTAFEEASKQIKARLQNI